MNVPIHYKIPEIVKIIQGEWIHKNEKAVPPTYLSLDSRKIIFPKGTLFFAIKSKHQNASYFIEFLYEKGVRNFVIEGKDFDISKFPLANIIRCANTVKALQQLAIHHRNRFNQLFTIGITGSNGKTIVKEWLYYLLQNEFNIVRSPRSFNSQIGVPLSVLNIQPSNDLGIFEAGISLPGEMKNLEKIVQPDIGIFTNIGNAHDEGFESKRQKIQEKLNLFSKTDYLIFSGDQKDVLDVINSFKKKHPHLKLFSWGKLPSNLFQILSIEKKKNNSFISASYQGKIEHISIPFRDDASIENAISCWCTLFVLGKAKKDIVKKFQFLYPIAMRLELKTGVNRSTIINDSYSNDLQSLNIALDFLNQQKQHAQHVVILSDILQSGIPLKKLYAQVAKLLKQYNIDTLYGIGKDISLHQNEFSFLRKKYFFENTDDFLKSGLSSQMKEEAILIKGARQFEFEKISHALEQKVHQTVLSINLNNLVQNLKTYKQQLKPSTKIMVMVKAFSYGSGSYEIASVLAYQKVDYLAVAYTDEGVTLRNAGITLPIMVMNIDESVFDTIVNNNLEPEIFSFDLLNAFVIYLRKNEIDNYPVHLKIDTGMHRLGFMENEIPKLMEIIENNKLIKVKSVFSHLASSDEKEQDEFTLEQFHVFKKCCKAIEKGIQYSFIKHIANTAAISSLPELQLDMVRLGIGLYGIDSNKKMQQKLQNVSMLTTTISQLKKVKSGETVGYGRHGKVEKESLIATVRIGYADGYSRILGNGNGKMLLKNKLVPVIGNVCMDMTMLDVTGIKGVQEGDEVIVFGERLPL
ncbi:MAG: bifunctional UDP-N-acetylmuramoyl-tripeptide:D-alanyl-D-alanine ligase/alanine racemase, partial [Ginsengibacter sp.]